MMYRLICNELARNLFRCRHNVVVVIDSVDNIFRGIFKGMMAVLSHEINEQVMDIRYLC